MNNSQTFLNGKVTLFHGDCRDVLKTLEDNSIDSVETDPPYHFTSWQTSFIWRGKKNEKC